MKTKLLCPICNKTYLQLSSYYKRNIKRKCNNYCSAECRNIGQLQRQYIHCQQCNKLFLQNAVVQKFCCQSCSAKYSNAHRKVGIRRSKIELFFQKQIKKSFPKLLVLYNDKTAIQLELDIYFPLLQLAIEVNGIVHYKPIYGGNKLAIIQDNDNRKLQACVKNNIEFISLDISACRKFSDKKMMEYWVLLYPIIKNKQLTLATIAK